ncbi:MAG: alpha/beta fold hydrolase [Myxococcales bacterium]|nr:alpha/beta fold hydrolase [Myxococcales bacterium]
MDRRAIAAILTLATGCVSYHSGALPDAPEDGAFATIRGTRVHYVDEGPEDAPAVVLVHGFASSLGVWAGVRPALRERFRVLSLDLKGFGHTDRPPPSDEHGYGPDEQARLVLALMEARGLERAAVVAHSYGSSVALAMALEAPERVERIALYDAWVYPEQLPTSFHWARARGLGEVIFGVFYTERSEDKIALAFHDAELIPQALIDTVEEQVRRPGTAAAALAAVRAMRYEAQAARYREIAQPTLLLWGREDAVTLLTYGERLVNELPNAELRVYPQCGHFPMIEARTPSTRDLVAFLEPPAPATPEAPAPLEPTPSPPEPATTEGGAPW